MWSKEKLKKIETFNCLYKQKEKFFTKQKFKQKKIFFGEKKKVV